MVKKESKAAPNPLTIEASLALSLQIIKELAKENGDSPRAIARYLIQLLGGKRAFGSRRLTDIALQSGGFGIDLQSGGWADLTTDCDEYKELEKCLFKKLHDMHLPSIIMGLDYHKHQADIASNKRGKVGDGGETINEIIVNLADANEHTEETAKQIWPHLFSELEELSVNPVVVEHPTDLRKSKYLYDSNSKTKPRKPITFGRFETVISTHRSKKKSR